MTTMKQTLAILSFVLLGCGPLKTEVDCKSDRKFELGKIEVSLPSCYRLFYPDSLEKDHFYIVKGDSSKLEVMTDGFASRDLLKEPEREPLLTYSTDTINNHFRRIGYQKKTSGYVFFVNIFDLDIPDKSVFDLVSDSSSNTLKNHKLFVKLIVNTTNGVEFSKTEIDRLYRAFKNSKVTKDKKPSH